MTPPSSAVDVVPESGTTSAAPKVQLTPQDWIREAMQILVHQSVEAVRVDVLAKRMKVTRGSFYWHFKDRNDLLERMLRHWRESATNQIIERLNKSAVSPRQRLTELMELPMRGTRAEDSAAVELAIRVWARDDALARQALEVVDAQRLSYLTHCLTEAGIDPVEARHRAFLCYSLIISTSLLRDHGDQREQVARRKYLEKLLLG